uniref:Uncharacterized protein n=1 Tax=Anguilla anguilla TaxID=7936 RepID=A0A0E9QUQ5_ANGAN
MSTGGPTQQQWQTHTRGSAL